MAKTSEEEAKLLIRKAKDLVSRIRRARTRREAKPMKRALHEIIRRAQARRVPLPLSDFPPSFRRSILKNPSDDWERKFEIWREREQTDFGEYTKKRACDFCGDFYRPEFEDEGCCSNECLLKLWAAEDEAEYFATKNRRR